MSVYVVKVLSVLLVVLFSIDHFESKFNLCFLIKKKLFLLFFSLPSGSMEPAFHRGDLLFLTNRVEDPIRVGEIVVFRIEGREIPIVHRVLKIHEKYVQTMSSLF